MVTHARQVGLFTAAMLLAGCGGGSGGERTQSSGESFAWLIPPSQVVDGGPGQDGIPSVDNPEFSGASGTSHVPDDDYVIAVRVDGEVRVYPHNILNWHEIVNDNDGATPVVMSYCPLTGSGIAWQASSAHSDKEFGVSGLLFNANLILYDRATGSRWSQMLEKSVWGSRAAEIPQKLQVIETKFATLRAMYPSARVMTRNTGFTDNYTAYPYDDYRENESLLFPARTTGCTPRPGSSAFVSARMITRARRISWTGSGPPRRRSMTSFSTSRSSWSATPPPISP